MDLNLNLKTLFTIFALLFCQSQSQVATVNLDKVMSLGWKFDGEDIIFYFNCEIKKLGWCGIGFGATMDHTDMIILQSDGSSITAKDTHSYTQEQPIIDTSLGGNNNIKLESSSVINGLLTAAIRRPLNTKDTLDNILYRNIETDFCFAYDDRAGFKYHRQNYGSGKIKFGTTQEESYFIKDGRYSAEPYDHHSKAMSVLWIGFVNLGAMIARYLKWWKFWFYLHLVLNSIVIGITMFSVYKIYEENSKKEYSSNYWQRLHSIIGLAIASLLVWQGVLGFISRIFISAKKSAISISLIRQIHHIIGWAMILLSAYNVISGWNLYNDNNLFIMIFLYFVVLILYVFLEFRIQILNFFKIIEVSSSPKNKKKEEAIFINNNKLNYNQIYKIIVNENKEWSFYNQYLLDVSKYIKNHPGGSNLIKSTIGQDIGKYIHGCSSIGEEYNSFTHPKYVYSQINSLIICDLGIEERVFKPLNSNQPAENIVWTVKSRHLIGENIYKLILENSNWEVIIPEGLSWMGKSYLVYGEYNGKPISRYYSHLSCDLQAWKQEIIQNQYSCSRLDKRNRNSRQISLYFKHYPKGKMTSYLKNLINGDNLKIVGPMGPGLMLDKSATGSYLAFAGGTGLLPFMDLIFSIWRNKLEDFTLYLYVSFSNEKEAIALDILKVMQTKYPSSFKLIISISKSHLMTPEMLERWTDLYKIQQTWICGPSGFNEWAYKMLRNRCYPHKKIIIL
ncbi:unnamed protein product [Blepharisma stoltei]|uniref:Cytochrome b5 heme-binding domain-containing protein n=1 Tax=Blepharisma stoltei TaxID=1481888 RepID=A0AAU9IJI1_9CILI|nr:unnamed protein product [Blepharisma stoltei]